MDIAENRSRYVRRSGDSDCEAQLFVPDIHCASCCWLIEQQLARLPGVTQAQSQLDTHKLTVRWRGDQLKPSELFAALAQIGYRALPWQPTQQQQHARQHQQQLLRRLGVAGILAMQVHMIAMGDYFGADDEMQHWLNVVALLLSLPVWFYCATPFFANAARNLKSLWRGLRSGTGELLTAGMDLPVALAIVAAAVASIVAVLQKTDDLYFDSIAMFVFLLLGARYLEARARGSIALQAQEPSLPDSCTRITSNGLHERIATSALQAGDTVLVNEGTIPVDGLVLEGAATVEQSAITGEFLPVDKQAGDQAMAGTQLTQGSLLLRATGWNESSHIARLHRRMEQALQQKSGRTVYDRMAQWFTPLVLLAACASAAFWLWRDPTQALPAFLAVLVASCPCALSLAIPAALTAATLHLRQRGILVTGKQVLHMLPCIRAMAFDKTGTLTRGRMQLLHTETLATEPAERCLAIAAALEKSSSHPVASAFAHSDTDLPAASEVQHVLHSGIEGTIDGRRYRIGKPAWCGDALPADAEQSPGLAISLASEGRVLARFTLDDTLRSDAADCIRALQAQGLHCAIVSGDHSGAVDAIASTLGIADVHRNCSPARKVELLDSLKQQHGVVAMVGDGINDGPVLAHADVSIAMAEASHTAQLAADVLLLDNRLADLLTLQLVALRTRRIARQNLAWALLYNISILPVAAAGLLPPVLAALGMAASSLLVTANALRLFGASKNSDRSLH